MRVNVSHNKTGGGGKKHIRRAYTWLAAQVVLVRYSSSIGAVRKRWRRLVGERSAMVARKMPKIASSVNENVRDGGQGY